MLVARPIQAQTGIASNPNLPKSATSATPPLQPQTGPGGSELPHNAVRKAYYGQGGEAYWLFEPAAPIPAQAPVIVFNHGWSSTNPQTYGAWLDHLVRRGNIVIYPRYQDDLSTPPTEWTINAVAGIKAALERLKSEAGHVRPDLSRFALVGHSVGGVLSANEAALATQNGLPRAKAVMSVMPGITWSLPLISVMLADLKTIPAETLLLSVEGESDNLVRDVDAKRIFNESTQVPAQNKNYLVLPTDAHGSPILWADHLSPGGFDSDYDDGEAATLANQAEGTPKVVAPQPPTLITRRAKGTSRPSRSVDALDYKLWSLFDALCDAAFYGKNREYALGDTPQQRFMGTWGDGTPVKELTVKSKP